MNAKVFKTVCFTWQKKNQDFTKISEISVICIEELRLQCRKTSITNNKTSSWLQVFKSVWKTTVNCTLIFEKAAVQKIYVNCQKNHCLEFVSNIFHYNIPHFIKLPVKYEGWLLGGSTDATTLRPRIGKDGKENC